MRSRRRPSAGPGTSPQGRLPAKLSQDTGGGRPQGDLTLPTLALEDGSDPRGALWDPGTHPLTCCQPQA